MPKRKLSRKKSVSRKKRRYSQIPAKKVEIKFHDCNYDEDIQGGNSGHEIRGTSNDLLQIAQGDGPSDRDGDEIWVRNIYVTGYVYLNGYTNTTMLTLPTNFRYQIFLILDKQCNGAVIDTGKVWTNQGGQTLRHSWLRDLRYTDRFEILASTTVNLDKKSLYYNESTPLAETPRTHDQFSLSCKKPLKVKYSSSTGAVSEIVRNCVWLVAIPCAGTLDSADYATIKCTSRVRFVG